MPLRHIGDIVIWEGNYRSDILIIGVKRQYLTKKSTDSAKRRVFGLSVNRNFQFTRRKTSSYSEFGALPKLHLKGVFPEFHEVKLRKIKIRRAVFDSRKG
jgi:hypothetical protein